MAKKQKKKKGLDFPEDVSHIGLYELVEIRTAEMENYMLPNQQTIVSNREGTKKVAILSRALNISEKTYQKKRRTV